MCKTLKTHSIFFFFFVKTNVSTSVIHFGWCSLVGTDVLIHTVNDTDPVLRCLDVTHSRCKLKMEQRVACGLFRLEQGF